MLGYVILGLGCALLVLLAIGMPVSFALGLVSVIGIFFLIDSASLYMVAVQTLRWGTTDVMACMVLFILMAEIIIFSGLQEGLFDMASKWLRWLPGGLANSCVGFCSIFAALSGSSAANTVTVGMITIPEMLKRGYSKSLTAGTIAAAGTLGVLIPPSTMMIVYAILTGESIGHLFLAGFVPGVIMAGIFIMYITSLAIIRPSVAPREPGVTWRSRLVSLRVGLPVSVLVVLVLGSIYGGVCTPTEAAALGCGGALIISIIRKKLNWGTLRAALLRTAQTCSFLFLLVICGSCFAFLLAYLGIPQQLTVLLTAWPVSPWMILVLANLFLIVLGCFMDPASILVLSIPILYPLMTSLGFDPIWFGIIVVLNTEIAGISPPVGINLFVLKSVSPPEVQLGDIIRGSAPFMLLLCLGIVLVSLFPQLALWLPSTMK